MLTSVAGWRAVGELEFRWLGCGQPLQRQLPAQAFNFSAHVFRKSWSNLPAFSFHLSLDHRGHWFGTYYPGHRFSELVFFHLLTYEAIYVIYTIISPEAIRGCLQVLYMDSGFDFLAFCFRGRSSKLYSSTSTCLQVDGSQFFLRFSSYRGYRANQCALQQTSKGGGSEVRLPSRDWISARLQGVLQ